MDYETLNPVKKQINIERNNVESQFTYDFIGNNSKKSAYNFENSEQDK
jgi:hypothetical protein